MAQTNDEYADFKAEADKPTDEKFALLAGIVDEARRRNNEIERLSAELQTEQDALHAILWIRLPALMDEMGLTEFKNKDGLKITVADEVFCSISAERNFAAMKWLEDNQHGGMIKREITVAFNKDQQDQATALLAELDGKYAGLSNKKAVHASTLKAWVKEMLRQGKALPNELFGIKQVRLAKIPGLK